MAVVALDAGGATLKASVTASGQARGSVKPSVVANYGATPASGGATVMGVALAELERRRARMILVRPIERGYCVNWNLESELYAHLLSAQVLDAAPGEHALVATAPLLAPRVVDESMDQVVFEELGFQAFARVCAPEMCVLSYAEHTRRVAAEAIAAAAATKSPTKKRRKRAAASPVAATKTGQSPARVEELTFASSSCHVVVDAGFSFTHVVPVIDGRAFLPGVKRIDVGGKLLTNYLKEVISFRQLDVKDDTRVIDELKHALCYCSTDLDADMRRLHHDRAQRKRWVLPDYASSFHGREATDQEAADDDLQTLEMGVEMVAVPELLFQPSDIGFDQAGVAETIMQAVRACPEHCHGAMLDNILLVGGSTKFRGFRERLERDLRPLVPDEYSISVVAPPDPILAAWQGCVAFAQSDAFEQRRVTKQEYDEHGSNLCRQRF